MNKILKIDEAASRSLNARARIKRGFVGSVGALLVLAFVALSTGILCAPDCDGVEKTLAAGMIGAPLCLSGGLRKEDDGNGDGGGRHSDDDPEMKMLLKIEKHLEEQKKELAELESKAAENEELKPELEALQKTVDTFTGLSHDVKEFQVRQELLERKLSNLRREASGDPLQRILGDEEKRGIITAPARVAYLRANNRPVPKELEDLAQRANVVTGSDPGDNYIDDELLTDVYQLAAQYGVYNQFDVQRPSSKTVKIPVDTSDPDVLVVTEGTAGSEEDYNGTQVTLNIDECVGWISVSNSMLEDDEIGLASHLMKKFMRQGAKRIDHFVMNADSNGTASLNGQQDGLFNAGTAYVLGSGDTSIDDVVYSDFVNMLYQADEALIEHERARWFMHPAFLVKLLSILDSGNGRPIFQTALEAPSSTAIGSILGVGVIRSHAAPKTDGVSKPLYAYGDLDAMAVAVRKDMEFASSTEAEFKANNTVFRMVLRAGVKLRNAGSIEVMTTAAS